LYTPLSLLSPVALPHFPETKSAAERLEAQRNGHAETTHDIDNEFWTALGGEGPIKSGTTEITGDGTLKDDASRHSPAMTSPLLPPSEEELDDPESPERLRTATLWGPAEAASAGKAASRSPTKLNRVSSGAARGPPSPSVAQPGASVARRSSSTA